MTIFTIAVRSPITLTGNQLLPSLWISPGVVRSRLSSRCHVLSYSVDLGGTRYATGHLIRQSTGQAGWTSAVVVAPPGAVNTFSGSVTAPLQHTFRRAMVCVAVVRDG